MTDTELNRRVATLAGYRNFHQEDGYVCAFFKDEPDCRPVPSYAYERDAILGLVEGLSLTEQNKIIDQLVGVAHRYQLPDMRAILTAPARDLCMAYVKAMECSRKHEPA